MAQYFYLSKITQAEVPNLGLANLHRLRTGYPGVEYLGGEIAGHPITGEPLHPALLVLVADEDHTRFQGDPDLVPIPVGTLDAQIMSLGTPVKLAVRAAIVALGFSQQVVDEVWSNTATLRDALNWHGRLNNPVFDVNSFNLTQF